MKLGFRLKHHFFNAFRELFVHHHSSLDFRAKIFALIIAVNDKPKIENFTKVKEIGSKIYKNDEDRINLLLLTTKEHVNKIHENKDLHIDRLIANIQSTLKVVPRYAKKIEIENLQPFLEFTYDEDIRSYQENILEFLQNIKDETLHTKSTQIALDEEKLSKISN